MKLTDVIHRLSIPQHPGRRRFEEQTSNIKQTSARQSIGFVDIKDISNRHSLRSLYLSKNIDKGLQLPEMMIRATAVLIFAHIATLDCVAAFRPPSYVKSSSSSSRATASGLASSTGSYLDTLSGPSSSSSSTSYSPSSYSPPSFYSAPAAPAPPAQSVTSPAATYGVDYNAVRQELKLLMDNPSWDDGSLAPIFIRLAWHSSGTYDKATGSGGSNGAGMRFATEAADPENAGSEVARVNFQELAIPICGSLPPTSALSIPVVDLSFHFLREGPTTQMEVTGPEPE